MRRYAIGITLAMGLAAMLGWTIGWINIRHAHWQSGHYLPLPLNDGEYATFDAVGYAGVALAAGILFALTRELIHYVIQWKMSED